MYFFNVWLIPGFIWIQNQLSIMYSFIQNHSKNVYNHILDLCKKNMFKNYKSHTSWMNLKILNFFIYIYKWIVLSGRKEIEFVDFLRMDLSWTCHSLDLSGLVSFMDFYLSQWKRILNLFSFTRCVSIHHLVLDTLGSSIEIFVQSTQSWKLALVQETKKIYPEPLPSVTSTFITIKLS